jgi:hypothetical protein
MLSSLCRTLSASTERPYFQLGLKTTLPEIQGRHRNFELARLYCIYNPFDIVQSTRYSAKSKISVFPTTCLYADGWLSSGLLRSKDRHLRTRRREDLKSYNTVCICHPNSMPFSGEILLWTVGRETELMYLDFADKANVTEFNGYILCGFVYHGRWIYFTYYCNLLFPCLIFCRCTNHSLDKRQSWLQTGHNCFSSRRGTHVTLCHCASTKHLATARTHNSPGTHSSTSS